MQVRVVVLDKDDNNPRFLESNLTLGVRVNAPIYTELTKEHKTSNYILHILKPREIIIFDRVGVSRVYVDRVPVIVPINKQD